MDVVFVERDILRDDLTAIRTDTIDEGDDALPPLIEIDVLGVSHRFHERLSEQPTIRALLPSRASKRPSSPSFRPA